MFKRKSELKNLYFFKAIFETNKFCRSNQTTFINLKEVTSNFQKIQKKQFQKFSTIVKSKKGDESTN